MSGAAAPARRTRSRRGEGDALRPQILAAAAELLAASGSEEAMSLRAVATAVGVTTPTIYRHFADKEQLVAAVCAQVFADLDTAMEQAATTHDDPLMSLRERGLAYVRFALANPEHYRLVMMRRPDAADEKALSELLQETTFRHLRDAVRRCQETGVFDPRHDADQLALALWAVGHGVASLLISHPGLAPDAERLTDLGISAVGAGLTQLPADACLPPAAPGSSGAQPKRRRAAGASSSA